MQALGPIASVNRRKEALRYAGTNRTLTLGNVLGRERNQAFSGMAWYRATASGFRCIMSKGEALLSGNGRGWGFNLLSGRLHIRMDNTAIANGIVVQTNSTGHNSGAWRHAAFTYSGSSTAAGFRIYSNGANEALTTVSDTLSATILNAEPFEIGSQDNDGFWVGKLDEVAYFSRVLTAAEITEAYNGGEVLDLTTASFAAALLGYWRMGEGSTYPTINDEVGSNDGTMVNMVRGDIRNREGPMV